MFDLLPLNWQFFSVLATFAAVMTAIFLPAFRDRKNLKVAATVAVSQVTKHRTIYRLDAFVTNHGRNRITLTSWGIRYRRDYTKRAGCLESVFKPGFEPLPKVLEHLDSIHFWAEIDPEDKENMEYLFCEDSTLRMWRPSRTARRAFQEDLKSLPDQSPNPIAMGRSNSLQERRAKQ